LFQRKLLSSLTHNYEQQYNAVNADNTICVSVPDKHFAYP